MLGHDEDGQSVVTRVLEGILFGALVCGIHCVGSVVFWYRFCGDGRGGQAWLDGIDLH